MSVRLSNYECTRKASTTRKELNKRELPMNYYLNIGLRQNRAPFLYDLSVQIRACLCGDVPASREQRLVVENYCTDTQ